MSPPGQPGPAAPSSPPANPPMLILDFSHKASGQSLPQRPPSLRERIAAWLDQPL